jgi:hypothetical protein
MTVGVMTEKIIGPDLGGEVNNITTEITPVEWIMGDELLFEDLAEVSFGLCCGNEMSVLFTSTANDPVTTTAFNYEVYLDDVLFDVFTVANDESTTRLFDFTSSPCGTIITIVCRCGSTFAGSPSVFSIATLQVTGVS